MQRKQEVRGKHEWSTTVPWVVVYCSFAESDQWGALPPRRRDIDTIDGELQTLIPRVR
jgi:hypothetical protein